MIEKRFNIDDKVLQRADREFVNTDLFYDMLCEYRKTGCEILRGKLFLAIGGLGSYIIKKKKWWRYEEDMVQDLMLFLARRNTLQTIDLEQRVTVPRFLYRITTNAMISYLRKQRQHQHVGIEEVSAQPLRDEILTRISNNPLNLKKLNMEEMKVIDFCMAWVEMDSRQVGMKVDLAEYFNISTARVRKLLNNIAEKMDVHEDYLVDETEF